MAFDDFDDSEEQESGAPAWVVTFGDMMSLLLTFFVLLLSFSEIDRVAFAQIMGSLKDAFGVQTVEILTDPHTAEQVKRVPQEGNAAGTELLDRLNSIFPGAFAGGSDGVDEDGQGAGRFTVNIPGEMLFDSGDSTLRSEFFPTLDKVCRLMKEEYPDMRLQVFGHTDNRPISTARFRNNWELSASRAVSVITYLINQCGIAAGRLVAIGYADSRPVAPNDTPANREKNRRVEFLFIEDGPDGNDQAEVP